MEVPAGLQITQLQLLPTMPPLARMDQGEYVSGNMVQAAQMEIFIMLKEPEEVLHGEIKLYLYQDNMTLQ